NQSEEKERQALNNIKKIVAKSGYHSDKLSEMDNELADDERRKRIQYPLDDDHNNHVVKVIKKEWHWCILYNNIPAILLGLVINSPSAGDDSDNYLESAPDTNYYTASNANCSNSPKNNHSAAPNTNHSDANNRSAAPLLILMLLKQFMVEVLL
ncbi:5927_t:CDS:2, partial [Dentiscutata heterogama]